MKTIILKTLATGIVAITLLFSGCTKDGATGPVGPQGTTGNANVQSQTFLAQQFTYNAIWTDYEMTITDNQITQSVLDNGLICAYIDLATSGGNYPEVQLPMSKFQMDVNFSLNTIQIKTPNNSVQGFFQQVKVVVIPARMKKPNVNHKNYKEIKAAYNL